MNDNENPLNSLILPILIRPILMQVKCDKNNFEKLQNLIKLYYDKDREKGCCCITNTPLCPY